MQISVVVPLYNKKEQICRALNSVFNQSFQPLEIIVVNDGSTDGSEVVVEELNHSLVNLVHQTNAGVSAARNKGIESAKGNWIAFLDADDEWNSNYLESIYDLNCKYPSALVLATSYKMQDKNSYNTSINLNKITFEGRIGILSNYFEVAAHSHPPLWTSAVCVYKNSIQQIGGFPIGVKSGEDLLTWAKLAVLYPIAYSLEPLSIFIQDSAHTYDDAPNRIPEKPDKVGIELVKIYKNNKTIIGLKKYIAHWYKMRASIYVRLGYNTDAFISIYKALTYDSLNIKLYFYLLLILVPVKQRNRIFKKLSSK